MAQHVTLTIQIDTQNNVHRGIGDFAITPQLEMDGVQIDDWVDRGEWAVLPSLDQRPDLVGDRTDGGWRYLDAIRLVQGVLNIARRHAFGVQPNDLLLQLVGTGLIGIQEGRLKGTVAVARHLDGGIARRGSQLAGALAVATIAGMVSFWGMARVAEMRRQLGLQHLLKRVGKQAGKDALLAEEIVDTFGAGQFLLNTFNRRQYGCGRLLSVSHGVTPFLIVRRGSIPQTSFIGGTPFTQSILHSHRFVTFVLALWLSAVLLSNVVDNSDPAIRPDWCLF